MYKISATLRMWIFMILDDEMCNTSYFAAEQISWKFGMQIDFINYKI